MITTNHTTTNVNVNNVIAAQEQQSPSDLKGLSNNTIADSFKHVLLEHYIHSIITKNEKDTITTDVAITDLQSGKLLVGHNLDVEQFAASDNKLPVTALLLTDLRAGKTTLSTQVTWDPSDVRAGEGVYDQPGAPTTATVQQLMFDMLNYSGNTAVRVLVNDVLGGAPAVNTRITSELGLQHTYLQPLPDDPSRFYLGNTTARDASTMIQKVLATQDSYGAFVKNALVTNIYTDYGARSQLAGNDYIVLANKVGFLDDPTGNNRHDVGVIYNTKTHKSYAYAFLNTAPGEAYALPTSQAGASLADMGAALLRYAGDKPVKDNAPMLKPLVQQSHVAPSIKVKY
jgi:beta-lactamase class A